MPVLAIAAFLVCLVGTPAGRRALVFIYLWVGCAAGFIGLFVIQPIRPGGWNFQFLLYPFLFAKWFFMGFMIAWGFGAFTNRLRGVASIVWFLAAIPLSLTVLELTYVPSVFRRDRAFWEATFSAPYSEEQLRLAPDRLSFQGRDLVSWQLQYHPHEIPRPVLAKLHTLGFNVLHARNTPPEIRAQAIAAAKAKLVNESVLWKRSKIVAPLIPLAANPTLDDDMFQDLAAIGDYEVISSLIRNDSNDDARWESLRETIQKRVTTAEPNNDSDRRDVARLQEQIAHLDRWRRFKKTGKWNSK